MKKTTLLFLLIISISVGMAQRILPADKKTIRNEERKMKDVALQILMGSSAEEMMRADSSFTRMLVQTLKIKNSFYYPFDSLINISTLYPPDSSFRIFTWQMVLDETIVRQHGAIQMHTPDGSLKLIPLIDKSDVIEHPEDTVTDNTAWIGAIYYRMLMHEFKGVKYYTLLGFDENNISSNRKYIEVLHFENGKPIFGGPFFSFPESPDLPHEPKRFVMEFKKYASPRMNYDEDLNLIVKEHLISETNEPKKKYTLIGDGDYEGFRWNQDCWDYVYKVFDQVTPEGQAPMPTPIRDDSGNIDDTQLKGRENDTPKPTPKKPKH